VDESIGLVSQRLTVLLFFNYLIYIFIYGQLLGVQFSRCWSLESERFALVLSRYHKTQLTTGRFFFVCVFMNAVVDRRGSKAIVIWFSIFIYPTGCRYCGPFIRRDFNARKCLCITSSFQCEQNIFRSIKLPGQFRLFSKPMEKLSLVTLFSCFFK